MRWTIQRHPNSRPAVGAGVAQRGGAAARRAARGGGGPGESLTYIRRLNQALRDPRRGGAGAHRGQCRPRAGRDRHRVPRRCRGACALEGCRCRGEGRAGAFPQGAVPRIAEDRAGPVHAAMRATRPNRSRSAATNTVFAPVYGPPFVRDLDGNRRYATLEDFRNFVKLSYMAPSIHHSGGTVCEPVDVPVNKRHLDMVYSHIRYSRQAVHGLGDRTGTRGRHGWRCAGFSLAPISSTTTRWSST